MTNRLWKAEGTGGRTAIPSDFNADIILIRHGAVDAEWRGVCYGRIDVMLDDGALAAMQQTLDWAAERKPNRVLHSGLTRTRLVAEAIADRLSDREIVERDARLLERDFGDWEGRRWDDIYEAYGEAIHHLISRPKSFAPGGGETTAAMQRRVTAWFEELPPHGPMIAITHSGPIAALVGGLLGKPADQWQDWLAAVGEAVAINRGQRRICKLPLFPKHAIDTADIGRSRGDADGPSTKLFGTSQPEA